MGNRQSPKTTARTQKSLHHGSYNAHSPDGAGVHLPNGSLINVINNNMDTYNITIFEDMAYNFEIEANSPEEAEQKALDEYDTGDLVPEHGGNRLDFYARVN